MKTLNKHIAHISAVILVIMILLPLIPLLLWAFTDVWIYPNILPSFTTGNFSEILENKKLIKAVFNSTWLSLLCTFVALLISFFPARAIGLKKFRGKKLLQILLFLPVMAPTLVILFGMSDMMMKIGIYRSYIGLVFAQVAFLIPMMTMILVPVFRNYDVGREHQAASLGIGPLNRLLFVTVPSLKSGIMIACLYTFLSSWATYLTVSMYAPKGFTTLAVMLFPLVSGGLTSNTFTAVVTLIFFLPPVAFLLFSSWVIGSDKVNKTGGGLLK